MIFESVDFSGGLRTAANPYSLQPNEAQRSENVYWLDTLGGLAGVLGTKNLNDTALAEETFRGFHRYYPSGGEAQFLAAINGKIYRGTTGANLTALSTPLSSSTDEVYFITINSVVYFCNGNNSDKLMSCTGSGDLIKNVASDSSNPYLLAYWKDRMWLGLVGDWVKCSEINAYTTFGTAACWSKLIGQNDNQEMTAFYPYKQYLLVFKRSRIYYITGYSPSTFEPQLLTAAVGCDSPRSIKEVGDVLVFHDANGYHTLQGLALDYRKDGTNRPLTHAVSDKMEAIPTAQRPFVATGIHRNYLKIAYNDPSLTGSYNNNIIEIDMDTERVMCTRPNVKARMFVTCNGEGDGGEVYFCKSDTSGIIQRIEVGSKYDVLSDGTGGDAIVQRWKSRPFPLEGFPFIHDAVRMWVEGYTGGSEITVNVYRDSMSGVIDSCSKAFVGGSGKYFVEAGQTRPDDLEWDEDFFAEVAWDIKQFVFNKNAQGSSLCFEFYHDESGYRMYVRRAAVEIKKAGWPIE